MILLLFSFCALSFFYYSGSETYQIRKTLISEAFQEKEVLKNTASFSANITASENTTSQQSKRAWLSCADSDGGIVSDVRGTITIDYRLSNGNEKEKSFSDVNVSYKGAKGIAEFYCEDVKPKVKFIECETESKGVCASISEESIPSLLEISAAVSADNSQFKKNITVGTEDPYISVNTPVYYKVVVANSGESTSEAVLTNSLVEKEVGILSDIQNEEILCPSGATCEGSLAEGGVTITDLYGEDSVVITYERDVSNSNPKSTLFIEKYELDSGDSTAVTLQVK